MADQIWGALSAVLDAEVVNGASDGIKDILIGGHSVGGGLGTLLSTRTEVRGSVPLEVGANLTSGATGCL